jgi:hypothetical protein
VTSGLWLAVLPAWASAVPETAWELRGDTSQEGAAQLEQASLLLPPQLRRVQARLRLEQVDSAPDVEALHSLVEQRGGELRVRLHPDTPVEQLARQLVHGLVEELDQASGWSRSSSWRRLSGWGLLGPAAERDLLSYASAAGMDSSGEDLATTVERLVLPGVQPPGALGEARCRIPTKLELAERLTGIPASPGSGACADLELVDLSSRAVERVEILYAQSSPEDPSSLVGHLMLGLIYEDGRREAYTMIAETRGVELGPKYILLGLAGGFGSAIERQPYARVIARYAGEDRGVIRLPVPLDEDQERRVLQRLDEVRQGWDRRYVFLTRNCTSFPLDVLETALDVDLGMPRVYTPDALLSRMERQGLIDPSRALVHPSPSARLAEAEARLEELRDQLSPPLAELVLQAESPQARDRIEAYRAIAEGGLAGSRAEAEALEEALALCEQREDTLSPRRDRSEELTEALWAAVVAVGTSTRATSGPRPLLAEARARPRSPLWQLELGVQAQDASAAGVVLGTTLYGAELGEARRYASPVGLAAELLHLELALAPQGLGVDAGLLELWRLPGTRRALQPGGHLALLQVRGDRDGQQLQPLVVGGMLELFQLQDHRVHLGLQSDLELGLRHEDGGWSQAVELPQSVFFGAGLSPDGYARVQGQLSWVPPLLSAQERLELEAGLRLGRRGPAALGLDYALSAPRRQALEQRLGLSLLVERY